MVKTNSKSIIESNKNHIIRHFEGVRNFVATIDNLKRPTAYFKGQSTSQAMRESIKGGDLLIYPEDMRKYLHRIGLVDDRKIDSHRGGVTDLYTSLMVRDGTALYNEYKKKHPTRR